MGEQSRSAMVSCRSPEQGQKEWPLQAEPGHTQPIIQHQEECSPPLPLTVTDRPTLQPSTRSVGRRSRPAYHIGKHVGALDPSVISGLSQTQRETRPQRMCAVCPCICWPNTSRITDCFKKWWWGCILKEINGQCKT